MRFELVGVAMILSKDDRGPRAWFRLSKFHIVVSTEDSSFRGEKSHPR